MPAIKPETAKAIVDTMKKFVKNDTSPEVRGWDFYVVISGGAVSGIEASYNNPESTSHVTGLTNRLSAMPERLEKALDSAFKANGLERSSHFKVRPSADFGLDP